MIDTSEPFTPGWWMQRLWKQLAAKQRRLQLLDDYYRGRPPLAMGSEQQRSAFYRFQRTARSNFAALIVQAMAERLKQRAIHTATDDDENGDEEAWRIYRGNRLAVDAADVHRQMLTMGESYVIVGAPEAGGLPVITGEDPRQVVTAWDPISRRTVAAFKLFHDDQQDMDLAYLWLPGEMWVASRQRKARTAPIVLQDPLLPAPLIPVSFSATSFDMADPVTYAVQDVPVVRFANRDGVGEFELHTDLLDRINHMILQRLVIATLQAFRQRAIEVHDSDDLPDVDDAGVPINYDDVFAADPGALWRLPGGAKIWESGQVDLTPILSSVKDDVLHLAAVTRTPLSMFTPDAATQTAEGASLQREGLNYKVDDVQGIAGASWAQVYSLAFQFVGDDTRADLSRLAVHWMPSERYSLAERAAADAQAVSLPFESKLRIIWQLTPDEIGRAVTQRADDMVFAQQVAAVQAAAVQPKASGAAQQ